MMMEPFSIVEEASEQRLSDRFVNLTSGKTADHDIQYQATLRERFPELTLTAVPATNCNILAFAGAGHAQIDLDTSTDPVLSWRGWVPSYGRNTTAGIGQTVFFAKYHLKWNSQDFIVYLVGGVQYILKEPRGSETVLTPSKITDKLIEAAGTWQSSDKDIVWIYDNYWRQDKGLWEQVAKAKWENVILDENMKKDLTDVSNKFFDNESVYKDLGVPWKRGIIFHGPAGNGKTISIKALMHTLHDRKRPINSLYVKSAPYVYNIGQVFAFARRCSPCMLIFEDIETIVNMQTRSYFLNEVDGLESNDGILMVASTNFLDRLDPGLTKRPSRFDRKYLFPLPNQHERTLYAEYWRNKVNKKESNRVSIDFPERLCSPMANITDGFSFAYMQEAFVASLLTIARDTAESATSPPPQAASFRPTFIRSAASQALYNNLNPNGLYGRDCLSDLDEYRLWRVFKENVRVLRGDMDKTSPESSSAPSPPSFKVPAVPTVRHTSTPQNAPTPLNDFYSPPYHADKPWNRQAGNDLDRNKLQDYQMQLMLLEQQNKKRLLQYRQQTEEAARQRDTSPSQSSSSDPLSGLPDALARLGVTPETRPEASRGLTSQVLPTLTVPGDREFVSNFVPTNDIPSMGGAGGKRPLINTSAINWAIQ
ncbi:ATPase-like protein 9 [Elsinoe australis]|uniref:ATPase-like protein 9 n=1 Tax=Elsinoe australis TaxID=40998 RepID=A0A4U7B6E8_9PEZI|nr:ATPase-like protein 9 [Elsinoe australis]